MHWAHARSGCSRALISSRSNGARGSCKGKLAQGSIDYGVYQKKALPTTSSRSAGCPKTSSSPTRSPPAPTWRRA